MCDLGNNSLALSNLFAVNWVIVVIEKKRSFPRTPRYDGHRRQIIGRDTIQSDHAARRMCSKTSMWQLHFSHPLIYEVTTIASNKQFYPFMHVFMAQND
jgi:hypothetical protein